MQRRLNEEWLERKIRGRSKDAPLPNDLSLEEKRLAHLGYLPCGQAKRTPAAGRRAVECGTDAPGYIPCTASSTTVPPPSRTVRVDAPPLVQSDLSLEEQRLAHLGYLPCTARGQAPARRLVDQGTEPLEDWHEKRRYGIALAEAFRNTRPDADIFMQRAASDAAPALEAPFYIRSAPAGTRYVTAPRCRSARIAPLAAEEDDVRPIGDVGAAPPIVNDCARRAAANVRDQPTARTDRCLSARLAPLAAEEDDDDDVRPIGDVATSIAVGTQNDAMRNSFQAGLDADIFEPKVVFAPPTATVPIAGSELASTMRDCASSPDADSSFEAGLDEWLSKMLAATGVAEVLEEHFPAPTAVPICDDADEVPRELQSLFAALDAAEAIADDDSDREDEPIYVNITAPIADDDVTHVCAADPTGVSAPHSRSSELMALLASLDAAEAIADEDDAEAEDVQDDNITTTPLAAALEAILHEPISVPKTALIAPEAILDEPASRCRSKDLLALLASLNNVEADDERDIEARIDAAIAVPTDHGRAVDLISYLESITAEHEDIVLIDDDVSAPEDVIAIPTSSGICTLPSVAYIDSVVSQVAAARAAVEAVATIDMEKEGRLPTISESTKEPSTTWSLPRTLNTDAYGLLFVGGASERSIAAAKAKLVSDAPLGTSVAGAAVAPIEVKSKKQKRREEKKKQYEAEIRAMGGRVEGDEEQESVLTTVEATHPVDSAPPPVQPVRSPQYDRLVGGENTEAQQPTATTATEQLMAQLLRMIPMAPVSAESAQLSRDALFTQVAASAAEMYGADSIQVAQMTGLRDAYRSEANQAVPIPAHPSPSDAADPNFTGADQERRNVRNQEAMQWWLNDAMSTPVADATIEYYRNLENRSADQSNIDTLLSECTSSDAKFWRKFVDEQQSRQAERFNKMRLDELMVRLAVGKDEVDQQRTIAEQSKDDPSVSATPDEYYRNLEQRASEQLSKMKLEKLMARFAADKDTLEKQRAIANKFNSDTPLSACASGEESLREQQRKRAKDLHNMIVELRKKAEARLTAENDAAETVPVAGEQSAASAPSDASRPAADDEVYQEPREQPRLNLQLRTKREQVNVQKVNNEEPRDAFEPRIRENVQQKNEENVLTQEVRDEVADAAERSSNEQRRAAVAMLAIELSQEATSPEVFVMLLSDVLKSRPRAKLMPFIEVILPCISSALFSDDIRSVAVLGDRLAERFIELQASSDAVLDDATLTAPQWIEQLLRRLQRPPRSRPLPRSKATDLDKLKADLKRQAKWAALSRGQNFPTPFASTEDERRAELEKKKVMLARMREAKERQEEERRRQQLENSEPVKTDNVSAEDAIARYAEEDRRRDAEKLRMREQARLAAQRMDENMEKKRATREEEEQYERERKEEKERLAEILKSIKESEREFRKMKEEVVGTKYEEQENVRMVEKYIQTFSEEEKLEENWKEEKKRLSQICEKYYQKEDRQQGADEELENSRNPTSEEEQLYARERKEERERLSQALTDLNQSATRELEWTAADEEKRIREEEQENVRMVDTYIQREALAAKRLLEREQEELQKAIDESVKRSDVLQASLEKLEAQNAPALEEDKRKNQLKTIRTLINNITPETADALTKEFLEHRVHEWTYLNDVVSIIFDKAVDEPEYCELFANLCFQQVQEELKANTNNVSLFRNSLLIRAQETFTTLEMDKNIKAQKSLLDAATNEYSKKQLEKDITETEKKWRRRKLGNIIFIGHMYRQKLISIRIITYCVVDLLQSVTARKNNSTEQIDEASVECAVRLLETTGARIQEDMDVADYGLRAPFSQLRPPSFPMDSVFETLEEALPLASSPVSAMITNLIELRKNGWGLKAVVPAPAPEAVDEDKENLQKPVQVAQQRPVALTVGRFPQQQERVGSLPTYRPPSPSSHWNCATCCVTNRNADEKCVACEEAKPTPAGAPTFGVHAKVITAASAIVSGADVLKTTPTWNCLFCRVSNKGADVKCEYCGETKPVKKKKKPTTSPSRPEVQSVGKLNSKFPVSKESKDITRRIGQCVINYGTNAIGLDEARDEIFKIIKYDCEHFLLPSTLIGFKRFMAAAVQKSSAAMGGREVAPAFGQVLAACLQAAEASRDKEIFEGITEFCREVVAKEAWKDTPNVWEIVTEVLVASHQTYGAAVPPRPSIADLQDVFQVAANDTHSACTLFVLFLVKLARKEHKRELFDDTLNDVISLIFAESVERPELNRFLASMCTAQINKERIKDVDAFRNSILVRAQETLSTASPDVMNKDLSQMPCAEAFAELKKIKFANIMFIGQLYLHGIVSSRIVMQCITDLQGTTLYPTGCFGQVDSDSVECAVHLITLCGEKLEQEAALPPATENTPRVVSEKSLDSLFDTLSAAARTVKDSVKMEIVQLAMLRAYGWKTPQHKHLEQTMNSPKDPKEVAHALSITPDTANTPSFLLRLEEIRMTQKVSSLLFDTTVHNKDAQTATFLSFKVHAHHALDKVVSLIFDRAVDLPNMQKVFASLCAAQIAAEIRDSGDSKFLQAVYDRICDVLEKDVNTLHVLHLEAAILKETDVYKKMLTQADLCQAKTDAKRVKHANIRFLSEIYLLNADVELARLLQTCLVDLLQTAFAKRNQEESVEIDWNSYGCAVDILEIVGRLLDEDTNKRVGESKSVAEDPSTPSLDCIFETLMHTSPRYGSFARLGEKVRGIFALRNTGWVVPPSMSETIVNKTIALLDSIPADQLVEELTNIHGVTDVGQLERLISHIFDKAAEHPEDGMFYASFCATLIASERAAAAEGCVDWIGSKILARSYEILDTSHYDKIVAAKEMDMQFVFDEEIKMTMTIDLIDLKCKLRKKTFSQILFIGHLFLNDVVHAAVLEHAVVNLLKTIDKNPMGQQTPDEESIECVLQLLQLCGSRLHDEIVRAALSGYSTPFNIHGTFDLLVMAKPRLNERLRLIMEQLVERRSCGWTSTPIRKHDNPCNEPWDLDYDYSEPDYMASYEDAEDDEETELEQDDNEETSDDEDEKKMEKADEAAGHDLKAKKVDGLPLPEGRWWESLQAQLESTGIKPKVPEVVFHAPVTVDEVKEVTPGFRMPYSPKKDDEERRDQDDKDVEIASDELELVESLVEMKSEEQKAGAYSPTQTGMGESYPIPVSAPSSINSNEQEVTPLNVQVPQELARQPYSDDEGDTTSSSTSSTSSSSTSSSTSSWSKVESVDSGSDYSNIDPASDSEM